ncbi:MAG: hypothetical protein RIB71_21230 [Imperialibacter sp.]|uniref:hypothetical protein n=1 Tax=Imperialibacter sp. TaxID=2038411 RepID=UPI0032ECB655
MKVAVIRSVYKSLQIIVLTGVISWLAGSELLAQGISFSYLVPKKGYVSAPVSPFSVRGLGYYFGPVGIETGGSIYSMSGLAMDKLPFEADKPLTGPHFSMLVPVELAFKVDTKIVTWRIRGGAAGIWHINPRLNEGNLDRALRDYEGWDVANADATIKTKIGLGWIAGTSFEWHIAKEFSVSTEVSYLSVASAATLTGDYIGGVQGGSLETKAIDFPDARVSLEGFEISLGVTLRR